VEDLAVPGQGQDASETGGSMRGGIELAEKLLPVGLIRGVRPGETGGVNAGRSTEGIDFQPGVVGEDEVFGETLGGSSSLQPGVFFQRVPDLFRGLDLRNAGEVGDLGENIAEDFADFVRFVRIVSRENQSLHGEGGSGIGSALCSGGGVPN